MVGESGVGKTSLIDRLSSDTFSAGVAPTIGAAYIKTTFSVGEKAVALNIWDTAGQEKFQSLVPFYMRNAHGLVFVFDVTSPTALQGLENIIIAVEDHIKPDVQLVLCGNKIDLLEDDLDLAPFANWGDSHGMRLMKASARTGAGVSALFSYMSKQIYTNCASNRQIRAESVLKDICAVDSDDRSNSTCC
jgi:small GTP-binding protein